MSWAGGVAALAAVPFVALIAGWREIRHLRAELAAARHQADHDSLTGVLTRSAFDDRLAVAVSRARRHRSVLALLVVDLDDFERLAAVHADDVADVVRQTVATHLVEIVRGEDVVGRLGADAFALLLDGVPSAEVAEQVADRLCALLRGPVGGTTVSITASVGGVVGVPGFKEQVTDFERDAELALQVARRRGRGRYEIFDRVEDRVRRSA